MGALAEGLRALGPTRLVAMAAVALAVAGFMLVLILHGGSQTMALLYGDLDLREAGQIAEQLDAQHIAHTVAPGGGSIMVPEADVGRARLLLARQGLPTGGSVGYELFDKTDGLTSTQFQQQVTQLRALEGELARTIRTISGVRAARVHLVLPHREPFERDRQDAQASILLTMAGGARLDTEGVQAVLNLVAAAVPGLRSHNVAIVDSRGDVLARAGQPAEGMGGAQGAEEMRHSIEQRLARAVEQMLERTVGPDRVRAEAAVDLDVGQMHETSEKYDPEGKVERSTQSVSDTSKTTEAPQSVSVQNNLPNANASEGATAGSQQQRQEETNNYEISKTVRTMVREQPEIRRISLAVLVDGTEAAGPDGKMVYAPRPKEELDHLTALVRGAIGFDEKRGDKVEVVNLRFVPVDQTAPSVGLRFLGLELNGPEVTRLAQTGVVGILALIGLMFVLRPMVMRLSATGDATFALADGGAAAAALASGDPARAILSGAVGGQAGAAAAAAGMLALTHDGHGPGGGADDAMVDVTNVEGQLRASALRRLIEMVDKNPEQSLAILRGWMQQDSA